MFRNVCKAYFFLPEKAKNQFWVPKWVKGLIKYPISRCRRDGGGRRSVFEYPFCYSCLSVPEGRKCATQSPTTQDSLGLLFIFSVFPSRLAALSMFLSKSLFLFTYFLIFEPIRKQIFWRTVSACLRCLWNLCCDSSSRTLLPTLKFISRSFKFKSQVIQPLLGRCDVWIQRACLG